METLGAILLLISGGVGTMLVRARRRSSEAAPGPPSETRARVPPRMVLHTEQEPPKA